MTELIKSLNSSLSFGQEAVTFCLPWAGHCLFVFSNQWFSNQMTCLVSKRWRSGQSPRIPLMWPGFESRRRHHMWVEFVVGSLPCSKRFFSGYSGFPLSSKTDTSIRPRARLNLTPNLLSPPKHINSDWVRVWHSSAYVHRKPSLFFTWLNTLRDYDLIAEKRSLKKIFGTIKEV